MVISLEYSLDHYFCLSLVYFCLPPHLFCRLVKASKDGVSVKVIAGKSMGIESEVRTIAPTYYLDFTMDPQSSLEQVFSPIRTFDACPDS